MICEDVKHKLAGVIDEELSPKEIAGLKKHMEECKSCMAEHDLQNQLRRIISSSYVPVSASEQKWSEFQSGLSKKISEMAVLQSEPRPVFRKYASFVFAFAGAAILAVVILTQLFFNNGVPKNNLDYKAEIVSTDYYDSNYELLEIVSEKETIVMVVENVSG